MITLDELLGKETETKQEVTTGFPSFDEFRARGNGYARMQNTMRSTDTYAQNSVYSVSSALPKQTEYEEDLVRPSRPQNFYEYVATQKSVSNVDDDLMDRLSRSNNMRPVYNSDANANQQMTAVFQDTKSTQKVRSTLNLKGKILLGAFLALVVTTVSLVIGFAGKINSGTAVVPASNANATTIVSTQVSNF